MIKRLIGLAISFVLLLTGLPVGAELIDVHGTKYEKAVQLLCDIGVWEKGASDYFWPEEEVTRADAASYIVSLSGISEMAASEIFSDVPPSHPAFAKIYQAHQLGLISGVGDGTFNPEGVVSYEQAAKMLVVLAGYKVHAEAAGGYPGGYLTIANQKGILDGLAPGATFTKGDLAHMLYNTLFVVPAEMASYGDENISFITEGENLLAKFLKIYMAEGTMEANCYTSISGGTVPEGEVRIGGENYIAPEALVHKIGREMRVYYKVNAQDEREVVSFVSRDGVTAITLNADEISPETTKEKLVYARREDERPVTVTLDGAHLIFNGSVLPDFESADLKPKQGVITVWETAAGKVTLVEVEAYVDLLCDDVDKEASIVYLKKNDYEKKELDYGDDSVKYIVTDTNGNPFALDALTENTVLSLIENRDKNVRKVIVSKETVSGKITEKTVDALMINGKEYSLSDAFGTVLPNVGEELLFRLNFAGEIVSADKSAFLRNYAYLMAASYEGKGLSASPKMKLLTLDNEIRVYPVAENVTVNDTLIGKDKLFNVSASLSAEQKAEVVKIFDLDSAMLGAKDNFAVEQLIVFEENADGEITKITTAINKNESTERDPNVFSLQFTAESAMFLAYSLRMFNSKYRVLTDTPVFTVGNKYTGSNDDEYKVVLGSALEHSGHYPGICLYDMNDVNEASCMVTKVDIGGGASLYDSSAVLVKEVMTVLTEDGEVTPAIRVVGAGGKETTIQFPDDMKATFSATVISDKDKDPLREIDPITKETSLPAEIPVSKLLPGDIIKYTDVNGTMTSAIVCFRAGSPTELEMAYEGTTRKWPSPTNDYYTNIWLYAKAECAEDASFRFYAKSANGEYRERVHTYGSATVLIFDRERGTVRVGDSSSLVKNDTFFASRKISAEQLVVIYR